MLDSLQSALQLLYAEIDCHLSTYGRKTEDSITAGGKAASSHVGKLIMAYGSTPYVGMAPNKNGDPH